LIPRDVAEATRRIRDEPELATLIQPSFDAVFSDQYDGLRAAVADARYESAMIYAGRHPGSKFLHDPTLDNAEIFLGRRSSDANGGALGMSIAI
jgi:hypothetical protein